MSIDDPDDTDLFYNNMKGMGVRRIQHNRASLPRTQPPIDRRARRAAAESHNDPTSVSSRTSDGRVLPVRPSESLHFALPDMPYRTLQQLRRGAISWQSGLDLHGYTVDEARLELEGFLSEAVGKQLRCVIVVHGKARSGIAGYPVIKSHVNAWLRELPEVLAFCSSLEKDGGTGAVYVLLKRRGQASL
ncbi:Smr/MutS family protein [Larsenimonas sp. GH3-8]|uniref:Smr/MutS family protein n=2 Tax=Larsenimonas rhizosphaerae TaxID=2944682 RepID=A0AA41ZG49_9GAMM|nr:Smr/MutS family protein [Larsenimonas rhizosphaerae]MCM2130574.1 Smr/MutS family protein [Larsenimonas rhizosphaerae]MCX2523278.1 Smr/MutS family protein [Larsenimonas rhizosphaerae]